MRTALFFNSLTRAIEPFAPIRPGHAGMYTCGPTVYNHAHIGNFRAYVFEDVLRRTLKWAGYRVTHVMNLTDVDDKTIRGAREMGISLNDYTRPFKEAFFQDLDTLGIERAERYPAATEHVADMIRLIERLIGNGMAYVSDDGSVYFSLASFPEYGKLAHLDRAGLRAGARVAHDEYEKEAVADFAIWKAWTEEDGGVAWDSPWGRGRPGWHIECSAMSMKYLGETFDIHTGGIDNLFPHHENEIAQSEGATGKPFVRYWLHNAHLQVEGRKMAKSLGNFFTLRDLMEKDYSGREVRYVLVSAHYRQTLNFTFAALDGARSALGRVDEFIARLQKTAAEGVAAPAVAPWTREAHERFAEAISTDLGTPSALAALYELVHSGNRALDEGAVSAAEAAGVLDALTDMDKVFGFLFRRHDAAAEAAPPLELLERRQAARQRRDFAESDRLRNELSALGWDVRDTPNGPELKRQGGAHV